MYEQEDIPAEIRNRKQPLRDWIKKLRKKKEDEDDTVDDDDVKPVDNGEIKKLSWLQIFKKWFLEFIGFKNGI